MENDVTKIEVPEVKELNQMRAEDVFAAASGGTTNYGGGSNDFGHFDWGNYGW